MLARHIGEFSDLGIETPDDFADFIDGIVLGAEGENVRSLENGRTAYWDPESGTLVISDPKNEGTAFRPDKGRTKFEELE